MDLINGMVPDENGGVCLIKRLIYNKYNSIISGCTCYDIIKHVDEYISLGSYVLPYKNMNPSYTIDITNESICLNLGSIISIVDWVNNYINILVTTGYTGYSGSTIENRVIYDQITTSFYIVKQTNNCTPDTLDSFAIIDTTMNPEAIWVSGSTNYFYEELDSCDKYTGNSFIKMKDINPISLTYGQTQITNKC